MAALPIAGTGTPGDCRLRKLTAAMLGLPVVAIAGSVDCTPEALEAMGIDAAFACCPGPMTL